MQLIIVRHAQSANNQLHWETGAKVGREPDPELTEIGRRQAHKLAGVWGKRGYPRPDYLYTSLMRRTMLTAVPTAEALDLQIEAREDTFECGGPYVGEGEKRQPHPGSSRQILSAISPRVHLPPIVTDQGWWTSPYEQDIDVVRRAVGVWQWLRDNHGDECVALVTHGCFGSFLLQAATGSKVWMYQNNTGTALVIDSPSGPELRWVNRVDHLDDEEWAASR